MHHDGNHQSPDLSRLNALCVLGTEEQESLSSRTQHRVPSHEGSIEHGLAHDQRRDEVENLEYRDREDEGAEREFEARTEDTRDRGERRPVFRSIVSNHRALSLYVRGGTLWLVSSPLHTRTRIGSGIAQSSDVGHLLTAQHEMINCRVELLSFFEHLIQLWQSWSSRLLFGLAFLISIKPRIFDLPSCLTFQTRWSGSEKGIKF